MSVNPLLCKACGEINDIWDITEDNHIHCKCGAIYEVSPEVAAAAHQTLQRSAHGCSIGCLVVILIGVVVLLVALSLLGQAIDGFFEGVRDFFEHPLNPFSWF